MLRSTIINIWGMGWRSRPSPSMLQVRAVRHRPVATLTSGGGSKATSPDAPKHHYQHLGDGVAKPSQPSMLQVRAVRLRPVAPSLSYIWGRCEALHPRSTRPLSYKWGMIITQIRDGIAKLYQPLDATGPCLWHRPVAPSLSYKWG